jgi:type II secretory pathway component PulF
LTELRRIRRESLTVPLAVLSDLVGSGVPVDSAAAAVLALATNARDADLVEFRRAVERDIALGAPPAAATAAAAAGFTAAAVQVNAGARQQRPGRP